MKTRESKKKLYISNYTEMYKTEFPEVIMNEKRIKDWEKLATYSWENRKKDITNKADALMWGIIDAKTRADIFKKAIKK